MSQRCGRQSRKVAWWKEERWQGTGDWHAGREAGDTKQELSELVLQAIERAFPLPCAQQAEERTNLKQAVKTEEIQLFKHYQK